MKIGEDDAAAGQAGEAGGERAAADQHRDDEAGEAEPHQRAAAAAVGAVRPDRRHRHPDQSRKAERGGDPEIGDVEVAADRRQQDLHRRIARRGDQHHRKEQGESFAGKAEAVHFTGFPRRDWTIDSARPVRACALPSAPRFANASVFPQNSGSIMSASWDEARRDGRFARGAAGGPLWHFLKGFIKHPVMVGSVIPSSKAVIDKMLDAGRLGELQIVRRIWPGRRHLHRACAAADGARRDA